MNNDELSRILGEYRLPKEPAGYWENFPGEVADKIAGERPVAAARTATVPLFWRFVLPAVGFAAIVLVFLIARKPRPVLVDQIANMRKYLAEIENVFPNQVSAIIFDTKGPRLVLADKPQVPPLSPMLVRVCDGPKCERIVTFSGQDVEVEGRKLSVLAAPDGRSIVFGDNLLWSEKTKFYPNTHWNIEAGPLDSAKVKG